MWKTEYMSRRLYPPVIVRNENDAPSILYAVRRREKKVARGGERNQNEHIVKVHNVCANAGLRLELRASCLRAER